MIELRDGGVVFVNDAPNADEGHVSLSASLAFHAYEDGVLVYDQRSGDTHLLHQAAASLLQRLQLAPASISELISIVTQSRYRPTQDAAAFVGDILSKLRELALIEVEFP